MMVSGVHPVRATKVRYYDDPQFQRRVLKPPRPKSVTLAAQGDDWSSRAPSILTMTWTSEPVQ
ncbi:type IV secretory pathway TraG/TraD family ATPase VirD4 [Bradyrhizobium niftali]